MKVNGEQFKEIICKANRISPEAKVKFIGRAWESFKEESEFVNQTYSSLKKIEIIFNKDDSEKDELIIHVS